MTPWKKYRLGDLVIHKKGFAFKSQWFVESGVGIVRVSDTTEESIDTFSCKFVDEDNAKLLSDYKLIYNDVVIATVGSWPPNFSSVVGKVIKVPKEAEGYLLNQNAVRLRINDKNDSLQSFLYYSLKNSFFQEYIINTAQGSANQASIKLEDIFNYKFNLPPLPEQRRIAEILGSLDDKIELNLEMNKTLEQMAMLLYKRWFVDFEFSDSTGKPYKSNGGEFIDSELGLIPKGWEVKKLGDVVDTLGGGTPSTSKPEYWENGTINWYSPTDLTKANSLFSLGSEKKINEVGLNKSSAKLFPAYSLLMSSRATIGAITINRKPACTNQGFITLIPNEVISLYQLHGWIVNNMDLILSEANGSTFKEITKGNFRQFPILKPKDNSMFIAQASNIYSIIEENIIENQTLSEIRDTVLPKLISGEVRVKVLEQDLRD